MTTPLTITTENALLSQSLHILATSTQNPLDKLEAHNKGAVQAGCKEQRFFTDIAPQDNCRAPDSPLSSAARAAPQMITSAARSALRCTCTYQLCDCPKLPESKLEDVNTSLQEPTREGTATRKVLEIVNRTKKPVVLEALYANTEHSELTQGTSGNDIWHSWRLGTIPVLDEIRGLFMISHIPDLAHGALQRGILQDSTEGTCQKRDR